MAEEPPKIPEIPVIPELSQEKQEIQALKDQIQLSDHIYTLQYTKLKETIETLGFFSNLGQFNQVIYSKLIEILERIEKIEEIINKNGK